MMRACIAACGLLAATAATGATDAEFAIRWDPTDGGPATIQAIAEVLGLPEGKRTTFVLRYFEVKQPAGLASEGASAIVRERRAAGVLESMYKLRSPVGFAGPASKPGPRCPFTVKAKWEREVDIGWNADGGIRKHYSGSCSAEGSIADLLPSHHQAVPLGCTSDMERLSANRLKVERWDLPGGKKAFEVSSKGKDTGAEIEAFARRVVQPLLARGVKPLEQSKTQLGSSCG